VPEGTSPHGRSIDAARYVGGQAKVLAGGFSVRGAVLAQPESDSSTIEQVSRNTRQRYFTASASA
jgi:hypothetical protein